MLRKLKERDRLYTVAFIVYAAVSLPALLWAPAWMVKQTGRGSGLTSAEYLRTIDENRKTVTQIVAGLPALFALFLLLRRTRVAEQGQITERFIKAVELIGARDLHEDQVIKVVEVRTGAIYALERIARDSERDHWPIMEILTAYIRQNAPWKETTEEMSVIPEPDKDVQAALIVIGRRKTEFDPDRVRLDLRFVDLRGARLVGAYLEHANLGLTHLEHANLRGAYLSDAILIGAHMDGALLPAAHIEGVDLSKTFGLATRQLSAAITDGNTRLPDYLSNASPAPSGEPS